MENFNSLSAEGQAVKYMLLNNRIVYSTLSSEMSALYVAEGAILSSAATISASAYICPNGVRYEYNQLSTFEENGFTGAGAGNKRPWAVSPYVMATAEHYGDTIQLGSLDIGGHTVNRISCVNLAEWAKTTGGFDLNYIQQLDIGDIELVLLDKDDDPIPDGSIPWFCPMKQFKAMFKQDSTLGLPGWTSPQIMFDGKKMAAPVVFGDRAGARSNELIWTIPKLGPGVIPDEYEEMFDVGNTYLGTTGDSGRPVYFMYEGKPVVVSHYHAIQLPSFDPNPQAPYFGIGPSYMDAFYVLKAFVEWYEGADNLKRLQV